MLLQNFQKKEWALLLFHLLNGSEKAVSTFKHIGKAIIKPICENHYSNEYNLGLVLADQEKLVCNVS